MASLRSRKSATSHSTAGAWQQSSNLNTTSGAAGDPIAVYSQQPLNPVFLPSRSRASRDGNNKDSRTPVAGKKPSHTGCKACCMRSLGRGLCGNALLLLLSPLWLLWLGLCRCRACTSACRQAPRRGRRLDDQWYFKHAGLLPQWPHSGAVAGDSVQQRLQQAVLQDTAVRVEVHCQAWVQEGGLGEHAGLPARRH